MRLRSPQQTPSSHQARYARLHSRCPQITSIQSVIDFNSCLHRPGDDRRAAPSANSSQPRPPYVTGTATPPQSFRPNAGAELFSHHPTMDEILIIDFKSKQYPVCVRVISAGDTESKKKPTWRNTLRCSTTSAYLITCPPSRGGGAVYLVVRQYRGAMLNTHMASPTL